jgi:hypothetical protein
MARARRALPGAPGCAVVMTSLPRRPILGRVGTLWSEIKNHRPAASRPNGAP